jgi:hypothetical protein
MQLAVAGIQWRVVVKAIIKLLVPQDACCAANSFSTRPLCSIELISSTYFEAVGAVTMRHFSFTGCSRRGKLSEMLGFIVIKIHFCALTPCILVGGY